MKALIAVGLLIAVVGVFGGSMAIVAVALAAFRYKALMAGLAMTWALLWALMERPQSAFVSR